MNDAFKDHDTKITDAHLTSSIKDDLQLFKMALWGVWLMESSDRVDGPTADDLGNLVIHYFNQRIPRGREESLKTLGFHDTL